MTVIRKEPATTVVYRYRIARRSIREDRTLEHVAGQRAQSDEEGYSQDAASPVHGLHLGNESLRDASRN